MSEKKEKLTKIKLKLKKNHPKKSFRLGRHLVGPVLEEFSLNEKEMKELQNKGCKAWLISEEEMKEEKKKKAAAKEKK